MCACRPNKVAMYREHAKKMRAMAQHAPNAKAKLLLLRAAKHLEKRAEDEERRCYSNP
jgi:hypothetical protein